MTAALRRRRIVIFILAFSGGVLSAQLFDSENERALEKVFYEKNESPRAITFTLETREFIDPWLREWASQSGRAEVYGFSVGQLLKISDYHRQIFDGRELTNYEALGLSAEEEAQLVDAFKEAESRVSSSLIVESKLTYDPNGKPQLEVEESLSEDYGKAVAQAFTAQFPETSLKGLQVLLLPAVDKELLRFGRLKRKTIVQKNDGFYSIKEYLINASGEEQITKAASVESARLRDVVRQEIEKAAPL